ncbi:ankyrin repeat-containing domain protein [Aspergillus aurantiobrunneus]
MQSLGDLVASLKLEINDLGDRRREITYEMDSRDGTTKQLTTLWTRRRYFTTHRGTMHDKVYLDGSTSGKLRVVKEIVAQNRGGRGRHAELEAMARVAREVGSENRRLFVESLGWFESPDRLSLVLEYCPSGDIEQCFPDPLPELVARGDIKPQNVLVAKKDALQVKIADFGSSKYTDGRTDLRSVYSNAGDIWSLGCLLYYILTKTEAFPVYQPLGDFYHGKIPYPTLPLIQHGLGRSGQEFLQRLSHPTPDSRPTAPVDLIVDWNISAGGRDRTQQGDPEHHLSLTSVHQLRPFSISQIPMDYWSAELLTATEPTDPQAIDISRIRALLDPQGCPDAVQLLLDYNAHPSTRTKPHNETVLHLASYRGNSKAFLKILHVLDSTGSTPLHLAIARLGDVRAVETLVTFGARTDIPGRGGIAPLQYALSLNREDKARVLLDNGADCNLPGPRGRRALHQATLSKQVSFSLIRQLVEKGADIDMEDDDGISPLCEAIRQDSPDVVEFLVDRGAGCALGSTQMAKRLEWILYRRGLPGPPRN